MKGLFNIESKFGRLLMNFGQIVLMSMYWLIFSLPIITSGAASCALFTTARKMLVEEEGKLFRTFKAAFKQNFKQGCIVGIATLLFLVLVIYCAFLMVLNGLLDNTLGVITGIIYLLVVLAILVYVHYLFAYISRFEDNLKTVLRNCVYLSLVHFDTSLRLGFQLAVAAAVFYFFDLTRYLPTIILLLPGVYTVLIVDPLEKVFRQYMPKDEDGDETEE